MLTRHLLLTYLIGGLWLKRATFGNYFSPQTATKSKEEWGQLNQQQILMGNIQYSLRMLFLFVAIVEGNRDVHLSVLLQKVNVSGFQYTIYTIYTKNQQTACCGPQKKDLLKRQTNLLRAKNTKSTSFFVIQETFKRDRMIWQFRKTTPLPPSLPSCLTIW